MAASGVTGFQQMELDILKEMAELAGLIRPGGDLKPALLKSLRRTLMSVLRSLEARGLRLWKREESQVVYTAIGGTAATTLTASTGVYYLATDTLEIMTGASFIRDASDIDTPLVETGRREYSTQSDKAIEGRPTQILVEPVGVGTDNGNRIPDILKVTLLPVPDLSTYELHYVRTKKLQDFASPNHEWDGPPKWLRLVQLEGAVACMPKGGLSQVERVDLKQQLSEERSAIFASDTEKGEIRWDPEVPVMGY